MAEIKNVIHLLPDSVANQIAAGEVIQRPASVVKELVENSIDAGATSVQIVVKDAGRTLIQVVDNGCGMSVTDARMAFERHATSKIQQATDLFALTTMGFRGEALPSIAAVSEIELRTKREDDITGTRIIINASKVESQEPDMCQSGTNIMVKKIFFNLPARRKFLKKDVVELGHISREFERLALVNTNVEFSLTHNDVLIHKLLPGGLKKRICDLFGQNLDHQLIPISTDTSLVKIEGFVGLPSNARKRNALQYFFVNGRNMRHPYFHRAVISCYENLISSDSQPNYFINLTVDPNTIDVNIHPQKHEIKFENEQPIWQILSAAIKESLGRFNASAAIDFDAVDAPDIPAFRSQPGTQPDLEVDLHYNPFKPERTPNQPVSSQQYTRQRPQSNWEKLYETFSSETGKSPSAIMPDNPDLTVIEEMPIVEHPSLINAQNAVPAAFQLKGRYIVSPSKSGLMLIDQHRAHLRILYEKFHAITQDGDISSQRLIFPEAVTLDACQNAVALTISDLLCSMGFDVSDLGNNNWAINALPSFMTNTSAADAFLNIISAVSDADEDVQESQWQKIALSMAQSAAIKYGANLSSEEIEQIISQLFRLPTPDYTPDGKPILKIIDLDEINKMF